MVFVKDSRSGGRWNGKGCAVVINGKEVHPFFWIFWQRAIDDGDICFFPKKGRNDNGH